MRKVEPYGFSIAGLERDPVHDRAHRVLADAEGDVAAGVGRGEDAGALELRLRRLDEVGRAADHRRRERLERLHHRRRPRRAWRASLPAGNDGQRLEPARTRRAARAPRPSPRAARGTPRVQAAKRPAHSACAAAPRVAGCAHVLVHLVRHVEVRRRGRAPSPPSPRAPPPRRAARRAPWPCPRRAGRGRRCGVRTTISDGRSLLGLRAPRCAARSASRSLASSTCWTCQP